MMQYDNFYRITNETRLVRKAWSSWAKEARLQVQSKKRLKSFTGGGDGSVAFTVADMFSSEHHSCERLIAQNNEHALRSVLVKWSWQVLASRCESVTQTRENLQVEVDNVKSKFLSSTAELSARNILSSLMVPIRVAFENWATLTKNCRLREEKQKLLKVQAHMTRQYLIGRCFCGFMALRDRHQTRAAVLQRIEYVKQQESMFMAKLCFNSMVQNKAEQRGETMVHELEERRKTVTLSMKKEANVAMMLLGGVASESTRRLMLNRWLELTKTNRYQDLVKVMDHDQKRADRQLAQTKDRFNTFLRTMEHKCNEAWNDPVRYGVLVSWASQSQWARLERKAASDWLARQEHQKKLAKESEQAESHKIKLLRLTQTVVDANFWRVLPQSFAAWSWLVRSGGIKRTTVNECATWSRRSAQAAAFKVWRVVISRSLLRLNALEYGKVVAATNLAGFAMRVFLSWRGLIAMRVGWISSRRLLALQSLVPIMQRVPRNAFHQWRDNADKVYKSIEHRGADRQEVLISQLYLSVWQAKTRQESWNRKDYTMKLYSILRGWRIQIMENRQTEWRVQRRFNNGGRDVILRKDAVELAVAQHERRTRAERMFAKWFNRDEHQRSLLPKYFAAWMLSLLEEHCEARADAIMMRMTEMNVRFRAAAEHLLGHTVARECNMGLIAVGWFGFLLLSWEVRRVKYFRVGASRKMMSMVESEILRKSMYAWRCLSQVQWSSVQARQRQAFRLKAGESARRLIRLSKETFGRLTIASAYIGWCSYTWQSTHRLHDDS
jgi:hypothetical protein